MKSTPLYELRKPHPNQARIDAASAALLRETASHYPPSIKSSEMGFPPHQCLKIPLGRTSIPRFQDTAVESS
jgi:hypothetical protein